MLVLGSTVYSWELSAYSNNLYPDISQAKFISPIGPVFAFQVCH